MAEADRDALMRRYLLEDAEDLLASDRRQVEEAYLAGDSHEMDATEESLIEEYLCGDLSARERQQFTKKFLRSRRQRRSVALSRAIIDHFSSAPARARTAPPVEQRWRRAWRFEGAPMVVAAAAMIAVIFGSILWLGVESGRLRKELSEAQAQQARLLKEVSERAAVASPARARGAAPVVAPFALATGLVRSRSASGESDSQDEARLDVSRADVARLEVGLPPKARYRAYAVEIRRLTDTSGEVVIWSDHDLAAHTSPVGRQVVVCDVPADILDGSYVVRVTGLGSDDSYTDVASYPFTAIRR